MLELKERTRRPGCKEREIWKEPMCREYEKAEDMFPKSKEYTIYLQKQDFYIKDNQ